MTTSLPCPAAKRLNKVPEVTLLFWIIKMMSTTVGVTAADYLNVDLSFGLAGTFLAMAALLVLVLFVQIRATRYVPSLYWMAVASVGVVGSLINDALSDGLPFALAAATGAFGVALIATLFVWHATEGTLSIRAIYTTRREWYYWTAILFAFGLGTAAGDWLSAGLSLGYPQAALLLAGLVGATALAASIFKVDRLSCFWFAYVLTCPLGDACADFLSQPASSGGLASVRWPRAHSSW